MKAADSVQLDQGIERKNEFHPAAPFVRPQREFLSAHLDVDRIPVIRRGDAHRNRDVRRSSEQFVRRPLNVRVDHAFVVLELHDIDRKFVR